nr:MAG TPA: helix-turn-helix domain protein [Caudoviricetes sp.]
MTQCERILRHLRDYGSITSLEAVQEYGIMRLASRVSDLKKAGMPIKAETVTGKNRYGERTSFARYSMAEGGNDG